MSQYDSGSNAWTVELNDAGLYADVASNIPAPGDLVFFDDDQDGRADRVAIVEEPVVETDEDAGTMTLTALYVIEGNSEDAVEENEYELSKVCILGNGLMPEQENFGEAEVISEDVKTEDSEVSEDEKYSIKATGESLEGRITSPVNIDGIKPLTTTAGIDASLVVNDVSWDGTTFEAQLEVDFDMIENDWDQEFHITLPSGVNMEALAGSVYEGRDSGGVHAFDYYFQQNSDGSWDIVINFVEGYVESGTTEEEGWIRASIEITGYTAEEDGLHIAGSDIVISWDDISGLDRSNPVRDITVAKTGYYDGENNQIIYTVTISTEKGTNGEIDVSDFLELVSIHAASNVTVSVSKNGQTVESNLTFNPTYDGEGNITGGTLSGTLPSLEAGESYTITYVVDIADDGVYEGTADNDVVAKTDGEDYWPEISDDKDVDVKISVDLLEKSAAIDEGVITWTIVVNQAGEDVSGFELTDDMFGQLKADDLTISPSTGYTVQTNSDGYVTSITFTGPDNYNTYTIIYTTRSDVTWGDSETEMTNRAHLEFEDESWDEEVNLWPGNGGLSKQNINSHEKEDGSYEIELTWQITVNVPIGGIEPGTSFGDIIVENEGDTEVIQDKNVQWFTKAQITALLDQFSGGISFSTGKWTDSGYETRTVTIPSSCYSIYVCNEQGQWVTYSSIQSDSSDSRYYGWVIVFNDSVEDYNDQFSDFIASWESWTASFTYGTTGNLALLGEGDNEDELDYLNYAFAGQHQAWAKNIEGTPVRKLGEDGQSTNSNATINDEDQTISWTVEVFVSEEHALAGDGYYTVVDDLPAGVELTEVRVNPSNIILTNDNSWTVSGQVDGTYEQNPDTATGGSKITLKIYDSAYSSLANSGGGYIEITYTCKITDEEILQQIMEGGSANYYNKVSVNYMDQEYGQDNNEQTVTWEDLDQNKKAVSKTGSYDTTEGHELHYSVVLNPNGEKLYYVDENGDPVYDENGNLIYPDTLDFTDQVYIDQVYEENGQGMLDAYLMLLDDSVKFYQLQELKGTWSEAVTDWAGNVTSGIFTTTDGTVYYYNVDGHDTDESFYVSGSSAYLKIELDIAWTFEQSTTDKHYEKYYYYTIRAEIPNELPILVEYTYVIQVPDDEDGNSRITISNTASLEGIGKDSDYTDEHYGKVDTEGVIWNPGTLTIHKVEEGNYGIVLSGAQFEVLKYDTSTHTFVSTGITVTTGQYGTVTLDEETLGSYYATNTGYCLVEAVSPDDYELSDSPERYYFYWSDSSNPETCYPDSFPDYATDLNNYAWNLYITNIKDDLILKKLWKDSDTGDDLVSHPDSISGTLYYYKSTVPPETSDSSETIEVYVNDYWNAGGNIATATVSKAYDIEIKMYVGNDYGHDNTGYNDNAFGVYYAIWDGYNEQYTLLTKEYTLADGWLTFTIPADELTTVMDIVSVVVGTAGQDVSDITIRNDLPDPQTTAPVAIGKYTLSEANGWELEIDYLPYCVNENGTLWYYYYYFVEDSNGYDVTYSNESDGEFEGVYPGGTITITNTGQPNYELPSAGGPGTGILIAAGLACAGGAGVLLIRNVHHSRVPYRKRRGRP